MASKRNYLLGSTVLAGVLATAAPSFAQQATQSTGEGTTEVGEIVVTGSRIRRLDIVSPAPLSVVTSETIDEKGFANLADAINEQLSLACRSARMAINKASASAVASSTCSTWAPTALWFW